MGTNVRNIVIGGEAGQGLVTVGQLLAKCLVRSGYSVVVTQSYQSRIRGGHNTFAIRVSDRDVIAPREAVDLLVALDANTQALHRNELAPGGRILAGEDIEVSDDVGLRIPLRELAPERFSNVAALGVVGSLLGLDQERVARTVEGFFGKKDPKIVQENRKALAEGFRWGGERSSAFAPLPAIGEPRRRLMMNGNEAIALGAISAGLRFYAFYPMTPSTSIGLTLARHAQRTGMIVEQAEDEIAVVNMAIGASFAGAPSMVGTSGGGFALMVEGVSLAGMTETPLVVVVGQRPGPATGLPTRTEQADLELVLHAGHGEFPRAVFAPGTVEECFHLTRRALDLAERYQTPVFILTDQFLADSYRAVEPFDASTLSQFRLGPQERVSEGPYRRHRITGSGVSPRLAPGLGRDLVVTDSDEHGEDGHITEDLSVRKRMVEKRLRKAEGILAEVLPPEVHGEEKPDLLLVAWGSTRGAVLEAASEVRAAGTGVGVLHFSQVWPLVPDEFMGVLEGAREVVSVEGNAFAQLARLIRREAGFQIDKRVLRYDGLPTTPDSILRGLKGES